MVEWPAPVVAWQPALLGTLIDVMAPGLVIHIGLCHPVGFQPLVPVDLASWLDQPWWPWPGPLTQYNKGGHISVLQL